MTEASSEVRKFEYRVIREPGCEIREIQRDVKGFFLGDRIGFMGKGAQLTGTGRIDIGRETRKSDKHISIVEVVSLRGIKGGVDEESICEI